MEKNETCTRKSDACGCCTENGACACEGCTCEACECERCDCAAKND